MIRNPSVWEGEGMQGDEATVLKAGAVIDGRYRIEALLGEGGFAEAIGTAWGAPRPRGLTLQRQNVNALERSFTQAYAYHQSV